MVYHATTEKLRSNDDLSQSTIITPYHINKEFMLADSFCWLLFFLLFFVLVEIASLVSMLPVYVLCAYKLTLVLYLACSEAYCPIDVVKFVAIFIWVVHAVLMLFVTEFYTYTWYICVEFC